MAKTSDYFNKSDVVSDRLIENDTPATNIQTGIIDTKITGSTTMPEKEGILRTFKSDISCASQVFTGISGKTYTRRWMHNPLTDMFNEGILGSNKCIYTSNEWESRAYKDTVNTSHTADGTSITILSGTSGGWKQYSPSNIGPVFNANEPFSISYSQSGLLANSSYTDGEVGFGFNDSSNFFGAPLYSLKADSIDLWHSGGTLNMVKSTKYPGATKLWFKYEKETAGGGINCYSSADGVTWNLDLTDNGLIGTEDIMVPMFYVDQDTVSNTVFGDFTFTGDNFLAQTNMWTEWAEEGVAQSDITHAEHGSDGGAFHCSLNRLYEIDKGNGINFTIDLGETVSTTPIIWLWANDEYGYINDDASKYYGAGIGYYERQSLANGTTTSKNLDVGPIEWADTDQDSGTGVGENARIMGTAVYTSGPGTEYDTPGFVTINYDIYAQSSTSSTYALRIRGTKIVPSSTPYLDRIYIGCNTGVSYRDGQPLSGNITVTAR